MRSYFVDCWIPEPGTNLSAVVYRLQGPPARFAASLLKNGERVDRLEAPSLPALVEQLSTIDSAFSRFMPPENKPDVFTMHASEGPGRCSFAAQPDSFHSSHSVPAEPMSLTTNEDPLVRGWMETQLQYGRIRKFQHKSGCAVYGVQAAEGRWTWSIAPEEFGTWALARCYHDLQQAIGDAESFFLTEQRRFSRPSSMRICRPGESQMSLLLVGHAQPTSDPATPMACGR